MVFFALNQKKITLQFQLSTPYRPALSLGASPAKDYRALDGILAASPQCGGSVPWPGGGGPRPAAGCSGGAVRPFNLAPPGSVHASCQGKILPLPQGIPQGVRFLAPIDASPWWSSLSGPAIMWASHYLIRGQSQGCRGAMEYGWNLL